MIKMSASSLDEFKTRCCGPRGDSKYSPHWERRACVVGRKNATYIAPNTIALKVSMSEKAC